MLTKTLYPQTKFLATPLPDTLNLSVVATVRPCRG